MGRVGGGEKLNYWLGNGDAVVGWSVRDKVCQRLKVQGRIGRVQVRCWLELWVGG